MDIAQIAFILNRQGGPFSELKFKHISQNQVPIYHDDENEHHNDDESLMMMLIFAHVLSRRLPKIIS